MKNKKGLSAFVAVMVLIFIVLTGTIVIWKVLTKTVNEGLEESKSCYDLLGMVKIGNENTCYDRINNEMYIFAEVGDVDIDGLFIVLVGEESSTSFELTNELTTITNLFDYTRSNQVKAPNKNGGSTYIVTNVIEKPLSIKIAPKTGDNLCGEDTFTNIGFC